MSFDSFFHGITTIISIQAGNNLLSGTGFFFFSVEDSNCEEYKKIQPKVKHDDKIHNIRSMWLVTNRHVVLPKINGSECLPDKLSFSLRKNESGSIKWVCIEISTEQLVDRLFLHKDSGIDVACIKVGDILIERSMQTDNLIELNNKQKGSSVFFSGINTLIIPERKNVQINVTDDIIVMGYPRGFYDEFNKYPIIKTGILASPQYLNYRGAPCFLIDCKLFPGSSGSLVISKPSYAKRINDKYVLNDYETFEFLGVFSGEPQNEKRYDFENMSIIEKNSYNLGVVWKSHLIPHIVNNGIKLG